MPNILNSQGIQTAGEPELVAYFETSYQAIYGATINVNVNSPDGQSINIEVQAGVDANELVMQVYNSMDPDQATGVVLDQRVSTNGIQRQGGTFTTQNMTIVVTQALTLNGMNQSVNPVYTVSDNAGVQWELITTQNPSGAGTYVYLFQAVNPGAVQSAINTINNQVTVVVGVASVNNPTTYTTLGIAQETDAALRLRRQISVSMASQGQYQALLAALQNVPGLTSAFVYENTSSLTNIYGQPGHSIWVIVQGAAAASAIANAIYVIRNLGCNMFGATSYIITQVDGSSFVVYWDVVAEEELYIQFTATSIDGINNPNISLILQQLPLIYVPGVNQSVNITTLGTFVQDIDSNTLVTNAEFATSPSGPFTNEILAPTSKNFQFTFNSGNINITPIILSPQTVNVPATLTQQFTPLGGLPTYTYVVLINNSGGSINSAGLYTAGSTNGVQDTIQVTDTNANIATAVVTVI